MKRRFCQDIYAIISLNLAKFSQLSLGFYPIKTFTPVSYDTGVRRVRRARSVALHEARLDLPEQEFRILSCTHDSPRDDPRVSRRSGQSRPR